MLRGLYRVLLQFEYTCSHRSENIQFRVFPRRRPHARLRDCDVCIRVYRYYQVKHKYQIKNAKLALHALRPTSHMPNMYAGFP